MIPAGSQKYRINPYGDSNERWGTGVLTLIPHPSSNGRNHWIAELTWSELGMPDSTEPLFRTEITTPPGTDQHQAAAQALSLIAATEMSHGHAYFNSYTVPQLGWRNKHADVVDLLRYNRRNDGTSLRHLHIAD